MKEALKLALEALEHLQPTALTSFYTIGNRDKAITAIKEALAQPEQGCEYCNHPLYCGTKCKNCGKAHPAVPTGHEQEPVAWIVWGDNNVPSLTFTKPADKYVFDSLYTTPPQRKPLTDKEIDKMFEEAEIGIYIDDQYKQRHMEVFYFGVRDCEAAHGIKE